jgi:hypothetical protein
MTTTLARNIEGAVRHADGLRWFRGYLSGLLDSETVSREELEGLLAAVHERLLAAGEEDGADLVLDGLDLLTGWCGPGMGIPDRQTA